MTGNLEKSQDDLERLLKGDLTLTSISFNYRRGSPGEWLSPETFDRLLKQSEQDTNYDSMSKTRRDKFVVSSILSALLNNKYLTSVKFYLELYSPTPCLTKSSWLKTMWEASCQLPSIQNIEMYNLTIENRHDVKYLSSPLRNHPTLKHIRIHDFFIYRHGFSMSNLPPSSVTAMRYSRLLDPLIDSVTTIGNLESLHIACAASYGTWRRGGEQIAYISTNALKRLLSPAVAAYRKQKGDNCCNPNGLKRLTLSKLDLGDDEFKCISECIAERKKGRRQQQRQQQKGSDCGGLIELNLNYNDNTSVGGMAILNSLAGIVSDDGDHHTNTQRTSLIPGYAQASILQSSVNQRDLVTNIERLEIFNGRRLSRKECSRLLHYVETNPNIYFVKANFPSHLIQKKIQLYTFANRSGRLSVMDPQTSPSLFVHILARSSSSPRPTSQPLHVLLGSILSDRTSNTGTKDREKHELRASVIWLFLRDRPALVTSGYHSNSSEHKNPKH